MFKRFLVVFAFAIFILPVSANPHSFTIVILPDAQMYSAYYPRYFQEQIDWILENQEEENIVFVGQVGDLVQADEERQWEVAKRAMYRLKEAGDLPWATLPGNHDGERGFSSYLTHFGSQLFASQEWFGGSFDASSYVFFEGNGVRYLALMLQFQAPPSVISWAQGILDENEDTPTVLLTHDYLTEGARTEYGEILWQNLVKSNQQIFAVFCGHMHDEFDQTSTNGAGKPVFEMLADYQEGSEGGAGYLRLYTFDGEGRQIRVRTFSPSLNKFETDENSEFQLAVDFDARGLAQPPRVGMNSLLWLGGGILFLVLAFWLLRSFAQSSGAGHRG